MTWHPHLGYFMLRYERITFICIHIYKFLLLFLKSFFFYKVQSNLNNLLLFLLQLLLLQLSSIPPLVYSKVFLYSLCYKSPQVSRALLHILADLNDAIVRMILP